MGRKRAALHWNGKVGRQELVDQNRTPSPAPKRQGKRSISSRCSCRANMCSMGQSSLLVRPMGRYRARQNGDTRMVWMFPVRLVTPGYTPVIDDQSLQRIRALRARALRKLSLEQLKRRAQNSATSPPSHRLSYIDRIMRNEVVVAYVKRAAEGKCDLCRQDAERTNHSLNAITFTI